MKTTTLALGAAFLLVGTPALAATDSAGSIPGATNSCELHVWASDQYSSISTGAMSGFGLIGGLIDAAIHEKETKANIALLGEYLDPAAQFAALKALDPAAKLGMSGATIVWHDEMLTAEHRKAVKAKQRFSSSSASCYAELIAGNIFYHRAAMYGSNLFGGFVVRNFSSGKPKISVGKVKNPLEAFPPKTEEAKEIAKTELRTAWAKNFDEFVVKKVKR